MSDERETQVTDRGLLMVSALCATAGFLIGYGESGEIQRACLYAGFGLIGPFALLVYLKLLGA